MAKKSMLKIEYARHRRCSPSLISRLVKQGRLVMTPEGRVDVEASDAKLEANRDPRRIGEVRSRPDRGAGAGRGDGPDAIRAARTRSELAIAEARELDLAQRRGELVRKDVAAKAATDAAQAVATGISSMPARIGSRIAAVLNVDARQVQAILDEEADALRASIADALRRLTGGGGDA